MSKSQKIRTFETGANRNSDEGKFDYEGFMCPLVLQRYGKFMHGHRHLEDGTLRASDNWQKGIPQDALIKSLLRHAHDLWMHHRGFSSETAESLQDSACAVIFNAMGYLRGDLLQPQEAMEPVMIKRHDGSYETIQAGMTGFHKVYENTEDFDAIVGGHDDHIKPDRQATHFYICGPMRGLPHLNFATFDAARDRGRDLGYQVTSPADLDRAAGITGYGYEDITDLDFKACVSRDVQAIIRLDNKKGDGLAVLPGWERSVGSVAEIALANWLGLQIVSATDFESPISHTIQQLVAWDSMIKRFMEGLNQ